MTEKINQLMKDVPAIRWTALILLASAMFFGYILWIYYRLYKNFCKHQEGGPPMPMGTMPVLKHS